MSKPGDGGRRSLRVLALAPYPESAPSTRVRVLQMVPALGALGVEITLRPFVSDEQYGLLRGAASPPLHKARVLAGALRDLAATVAAAGAYDAVWIQRALAPLLGNAFLGGLRARGIPWIYDFDDAVYLPQEGGRPWLELLRAPERTTTELIRGSARVLAGNAWLADFAARADGRAGHVLTVPSVVDTERFRPPARPRTTADHPTLGWIGSATTLRYLEGLAEPLRALQARVPHRLLVVAGSEPPHLPGVTFEYRSWRPEDEVGYFQELDVGLYPLDDTPWSRGKCGFKAIQYLACEVPCVASPVGVLREIVRDGETGLLASYAGDWVEACARLLADADARRRLGPAGRRLVQREYSVSAQVPRIAEALVAAGTR